MLKIKDLVLANKRQLERMNAPNTENEPVEEILIFEKALPHKDNMINIIDCPLATNEHRGTHALGVGGVITAGYENIKLTAMHMTVKWTPVIEWCIENNIRVISMSIATFYTDEREEALKKYAEWGGIVIAASGNWEDKSVSFPAKSQYTIGVSATNTEDSNGFQVDVTVDSWWKTKRYDRDEFISFTGTSCSQPVQAFVARLYLNYNPKGNIETFRTWILINSIKNIDHLKYDHSFGDLEPGERFFVFPDDMIDKLIPVNIVLTLDEKTMLVNGKEIDLRIKPFYKKYTDENGKLYSALCTELRPVFESAKFKVGWNKWTKKATMDR